MISVVSFSIRKNGASKHISFHEIGYHNMFHLYRIMIIDKYTGCFLDHISFSAISYYTDIQNDKYTGCDWIIFHFQLYHIIQILPGSLT